MNHFCCSCCGRITALHWRVMFQQRVCATCFHWARQAGVRDPMGQGL